MKKSILFAYLLAVMGTAQAQKLTYVPWTENTTLEGCAVSANGEYVAGRDMEGRAFIYDTHTGEMKYYYHPDFKDDQTKDSKVISVNDNGVGVGFYADYAARFDFSTGTHTEPFGDDMASAHFINNDGTLECGFMYDKAHARTPYVLVNGEKQLLPEATDTWLGYETMGSAAMSASDDGSVIMGLAQDNYATFPLVLWVRNKDNTSYSLVPVSRRFYDGSFELNGPQEYQMFQGRAFSANGRWIAVDIVSKDFTEGGRVARYDVANDMVELIDCPDANGEFSYTARGISNDGTIIGYVESQKTFSRTAFIVKGAENTAQYMADVYEEAPEIGTMDRNGLNTPMGISPDGRYIVGFGYVDLDENTLGLGTYYIDTQAESDGVKDVAKRDEAAAQGKVVATYTIDGKQVDLSQGERKGVVIEKLANGRFVKRVVR